MSERRPPFSGDPEQAKRIAEGQDLTPVQRERSSDDVANSTMAFGDVRDRSVIRGPKLSFADLPDVPEEDRVGMFSVAEIKEYEQEEIRRRELAVIKDFLENQTPVVVVRKNGEEVQGSVYRIKENSRTVILRFRGVNKKKPVRNFFKIEENLQKEVPFETFLSWQQ